MGCDMEFKRLIIFLCLLTLAHSINPRCNIISENLKFGQIIKGNNVVFNDRYLNSGGVLGSRFIYTNYPAFVRSPGVTLSRLTKKTLNLNKDKTDELNKLDGQFYKENSPDFNIDESETGDELNRNTQNTPDLTSLSQNHGSVYKNANVGGFYAQNKTEAVESGLNNSESSDSTQSGTAASCKLVKHDQGAVETLLSRLNLKRDWASVTDKLKKAKQGVASALYPSGASEQAVRFTNWKMLERTLLSMSSTVALNVKPLSVADAEEDKNVVGFLRSKLAKTKLSTLLLASLFKDLVSRVLNFYWFNKCIRVADNPRAYRLMSTLGFSLLTLWDFFINLNALEPKALLLAVNHVFKQMFTQTSTAINQHYYATSYWLNDQKEDEFSFIFDILGMSLGMYASYLVNEVNSNELKLATIGSSLLLSNLITLIVARFLKST
ncbi:conserved hypothetical protein [Theileria orientalis strain Shintoku]|uniref:Uncharacterized protein n=1 Tax=Theileria orientalis strain Shintoku TaxID=869250 RepID=J4C4C8_THEOR|nr:conserved hypothetical protein [Theileria orientalis strain Shintoku]BAM41961.1 conserved hypothetical protein [Theileria orientalis strain Shintoku]|eukprot:XP_009692262.1 conserved hypothetical protein [Theileria orientalis strain Shintoku]